MSSLSLRLPESLHQKLRELAERDDVSAATSGRRASHVAGQLHRDSTAQATTDQADQPARREPLSDGVGAMIGRTRGGEER